LRDHFLRPSNILHINISKKKIREGGDLQRGEGLVWRGGKNKGNPKFISSPSRHPPAWTPWVSSPSPIFTSRSPQTPSHDLILPAHNLSANTLSLPKTNQTYSLPLAKPKSTAPYLCKRRKQKPANRSPSLSLPISSALP
jgi:hypothetical protein